MTVRGWVLTRPSLVFWLCLSALNISVVAWHFPLSSLTLEPATGGDTGSHFYSLFRLYNSGFRVWDPHHLMGQLHLVHYFPIPFFIMRFFALFLPLGLSFNLGLILPTVLLPISVTYAFRTAGASKRASALANTLTLLFFYNESYSIWGGNGLSTLAGQFAHLYALIFFILLIGFGSKAKLNWADGAIMALLTGLICSSHSYVFLFVPPIYASLIVRSLFFKHSKTVTKSLFIYLGSGALGLINSAWFFVPQIDQLPWTYPFAMRWNFEGQWSTLFPPYLIGIGAISLIFFGLFKDTRKPTHNLQLPLTVMSVTSLLFFFIFPHIGLIDIRSLPQLYFGLTLLCSLFLSQLIESCDARTQKLLYGFMITLALSYNLIQTKNYPYWAKWNFSGWSNKPLFNEARSVMSYLAQFEDSSRVIYEHSPSLNNAGTTRVFELLPAFANRSTLESLYTESTHTAFITHDLQARVSAEPSCPDPRRLCPRLELDSLKQKLQLAGVSQLILNSEQSKKLLNDSNLFLTQYQTQTFSILALNEPVTLVDIITKPIVHIPKNDWKSQFQSWYLNYPKAADHFLTFNPYQDLGNLEPPHVEPNINPCQISLDAKINTLTLTTSCPSQPHLVKFAYSPFLKASNQSPLYPISPGFIWLIPKSKHLVIEFKTPLSWRLMDFVSLFGLFLSLLLILLHKVSKIK